MLLGGKRYTADEVLSLGLVLEVAPVGMAGNRAVEIAQNMTSDCPKEVVALAKELLTSGAYRSAAESKEAEFAAESQVSAGDTYATFPKKIT
jgi:enoyl-CoA hydratase/carnithine racemase